MGLLDRQIVQVRPPGRRLTVKLGSLAFVPATARGPGQLSQQFRVGTTRVPQAPPLGLRLRKAVQSLERTRARLDHRGQTCSGAGKRLEAPQGRSGQARFPFFARQIELDRDRGRVARCSFTPALERRLRSMLPLRQIAKLGQHQRPLAWPRRQHQGSLQRLSRVVFLAGYLAQQLERRKARRLRGRFCTRRPAGRQFGGLALAVLAAQKIQDARKIKPAQRRLGPRGPLGTPAHDLLEIAHGGWMYRRRGRDHAACRRLCVCRHPGQRAPVGIRHAQEHLPGAGGDDRLHQQHALATRNPQCGRILIQRSRPHHIPTHHQATV